MNVKIRNKFIEIKYSVSNTVFLSLLLLFYPNVPVASESNDGYSSKKVATI